MKRGIYMAALAVKIFLSILKACFKEMLLYKTVHSKLFFYNQN